MHFPFCESKCNYCDFYSAKFPASLQRDYVSQLCSLLKEWSSKLSLPADTLYLGGGTPTVLPAGDLVQVIGDAVKAFGPFHEITVEANPADSLAETFIQLHNAGVNRVSLGMQSAVAGELERLGRRHTTAQLIRCVEDLQGAKIENLSLDIMLGIPRQTAESLQYTLDFALSLSPRHISAYMLKIEPGTPFGRSLPSGLPDDDQTAALYLQLCDKLRKAGFCHYEISNFSRPGFESRHNLKYWTLAPYLGLGPGAHSFIGGRRFYYPRDLAAFLTDRSIVPDGSGGDESEYVMLRLRLAEGLDYGKFYSRYGVDFYAAHHPLIKRLQDAGLAHRDAARLRLTERGFLLSNAILAELL